MKKLLVVGGIVSVVGAALWLLSQPKSPEQLLEDRATQYIQLATAFARNNPNDIDMYWGPASLDQSGDDGGPGLSDLADQVMALRDEISNEPLGIDPPREERLKFRLQNLLTLLEISQQSDRPKFLEEMQRLYGINLDTIPSVELQENLDTLEDLLPGRGTLAFRIASYRNRMLIPADKRKAVFEAALNECRNRTAQRWNLPASESIELVWSRDTAAAWHTYLGEGRSILTLNDLSIAFLDSAIDVACHEAYPGHHAQYTLRESIGQYLEDSLVMLRSPESVLLEGAANLGVELVFPVEERIQFEHEVLAEIAGISPPDVEQYLAIKSTINELEAAVLPIVQEYYDGEIAFNTATFRLEREAIISSPSALLEFIDDFGTYSIGYTLAEALLREQVQSLPNEAMKWERLLQLVTTPTESAARLFTAIP